MSIPKINIQEINKTAMHQITQHGAAFIKLPDNIYNGLVKLNNTSKIFFDQDPEQKSIDPFSPEKNKL